MIFTPEILTIYILDILFLGFASIAFYYSLKIALNYNRNQNTPLQYDLEKKSYLASTIIKFILFIKIPMFVFFVFTLDKLSNILVGAMCAAGVVNATEYGVPLLILKMLNLYLFAFWITLNSEDMKTEEQRYFKAKFLLFLIAFVFLVIEIIVEILMFSSIDITSVVDCCGAIFSVTDTTYISEILAKEKFLTILFYANFAVLVVTYFMKNRIIYGVFSFSFLIIALLSLISFFGTYIYELPTHHCPFCMLQKDYMYIGYLLYIFLFYGTFYGISLTFLEYEEKELQRRFLLSLWLNIAYIIAISYYPLAYYIKNGVFL
ncbi:hypothetical protein [Sulfurimonas sp. C5]|uniref:hypothetical protein n=1 Tax=Sulfurimonas sp. C5 TaxID=3036947 RepID=UPI0024567B6E|nr:hypothetical protein [Sulfurimonas sp. C5]MDH4944212.1 hypothetical protein [Sulfurimonas sp. C5]